MDRPPSAEHLPECPVEKKNGHDRISVGRSIHSSRIETQPPSQNGLALQFLSQTVVVSSQDVLSFQMLPRIPERGLVIHHGCGCGRGIRFQKQHHRTILTAVGMVIKGWNDFKKFSIKVVCRDLLSRPTKKP